MNALSRTLAAFLCVVGLATAAEPARDLVLAVGAPGEPRFGEAFEKAAAAWTKEATAAGMKVHRIPTTAASLEALRKELAALPRDGGDLWIVLLGHGTDDGRHPRFNLTGDDLSAPELAGLLRDFQRRVIVLTLFSASGAFLADLSGENRVILAATRNGAERNYSRFGEKLAASLGDPDADLDGDGAVTLLELAVRADAETRTFYENDQRVVTEHATLDDNGDRAGTEIRRLRETTPPPTPNADGALAREIFLRTGVSGPAFTAGQLRERDALEARIAALRQRKAELGEPAYLDALEPLLREMADLYAKARAGKSNR